MRFSSYTVKQVLEPLLPQLEAELQQHGIAAEQAAGIGQSISAFLSSALPTILEKHTEAYMEELAREMRRQARSF